MWREPPVRTNGATPFSSIISYFAIAGSNPYTSRIERSLDGSMLSMSILYESYDMRSIMASARVLSPPQICWYHSLSRNCEQKIVDDFLRLLCISSKRFLASASVYTFLHNVKKIKHLSFSFSILFLVFIFSAY